MPTEHIEQQMFLMTMEILQNDLLSCPKLSNYHFIKLLCHCPESLETRKDLFQQKLNAFFDEIYKNPQSTALLRGARKISHIVSNNQELKPLCGSRFTNPTFLLKEGTPYVFDRFLWAEHIPGWRAMFLGFMHSNKPLQISLKKVQIIEQFMRTKKLPLDYYHADFPTKEIIKLHDKAKQLLYIHLQLACQVLLQDKHINGETVIRLLVMGLEKNNPDLIGACIKFINESTDDFRLEAFKTEDKEGIKVSIAGQFDENTHEILSGPLSEYIYAVEIFTHEGAQTVIDKALDFPEALHLRIVDFNSPNMNSIGAFFPKVKTLRIPADLYEAMPAPWFSIEFLHLTTIKVTTIKAKRLPLSSNLKLCMIYNDFPYGKKMHMQVIEGQKLICKWNSKTETIDFSELASADKALITDAIFSQLMTAQELSSKLKTLTVRGCEKLTNKTAILIASHLKNLERLEITGSQFTEDGIVQISENLKNLRQLFFMNNSLITDHAGISIATNLRNLLALSLANSKITDATVEAIITHLKQLQGLGLTHCNITDTSGIAIAKHLKFLKHLYLAHCDQLTDKTGEQIATNLYNLELLNLNGCSMTERTHLAINKYLKKLKHKQL